MELVNNKVNMNAQHVTNSESARDKMLVALDDDRLFLRTLSRAAMKHRMICIGCETIEAFFEATMYFNNAVVLIDQHLGLSKQVFNRPRYYQNGDQLLKLIAAKKVYLMSSDPKVLMVAMEHAERVKGFISKDIGATNIIKFISELPSSPTT